MCWKKLHCPRCEHCENAVTTLFTTGVIKPQVHWFLEGLSVNFSVGVMAMVGSEQLAECSGHSCSHSRPLLLPSLKVFIF